MSWFDSVKPFCSCVGLFPGVKTNAGKLLPAKTRRSTHRESQALTMAAAVASGSACTAAKFRASSTVTLPGQYNNPSSNEFPWLKNNAGGASA